MSFHINFAHISDYYQGQSPNNEIIRPQVIKGSVAIFLLLSMQIYLCDKARILDGTKVF